MASLTAACSAGRSVLPPLLGDSRPGLPRTRNAATTLFPAGALPHPQRTFRPCISPSHSHRHRRPCGAALSQHSSHGRTHDTPTQPLGTLAPVSPQSQNQHQGPREPAPAGGEGCLLDGVLTWLRVHLDLRRMLSQWHVALAKASLLVAILGAAVLAGLSPLRPAPARAVTAEISLGTPHTTTAPRSSLRMWLLYKLDLVFASNPSYKVLSLAGVCAVVTLIGGVAYSAADQNPLGEATWTAWSLLIDAGAQKAQDTPAKRRVAVVLTVAGVLFLATLLGIVVEAAGGRLESLRKGRTRVLESGHTLIIGWNSKTVPLARELMISYNKATPRQRHPVVVLGGTDKEVMDDKIRSAFSAAERGNFRIVARSGSPFSLRDLSRCSAQAASSIIVLAPEELTDPNAADQHVIHAALGVSLRPDISANIVADLSSKDSVHMLKRLYSALRTKPRPLLGRGGDAHEDPITPVTDTVAPSTAVPAKKAAVRRLVPVATGDAALRALVVTAVNPRCAGVWTELLTFDGNEYHFQQWPELTGERFGDAMFKFDAAILCGILRPTQGAAPTEHSANQMLYCPHPDTFIQEGDQLLFIAEDRYSFKPGPSRRSPAEPGVDLSVRVGGEGAKKAGVPQASPGDSAAVRPKQRVLISWWRPDAKAMLELLGACLHPGSSVTILDGASIDPGERKVIKDTAKRANLGLDFWDSSSSSAEASELSVLPLENFDTVLVLRPSLSQAAQSSAATSEGGVSAQESATATAMLIKNMQVCRGRSDSQVVAEVTFEESSEPALSAVREASGVSFSMVPEAVQAQVLAQLSENADVGKLLDSLVGKHLGSLEPKSVLRYAKTGEFLSFWDLQDRAVQQQKEVIVAWQRGGAKGSYWEVNPTNKEEKLPWGPDDQVMVIKAGQLEGYL